MSRSPDHDVINIRDWVRTAAGLRKRTARDPPTPLWLQGLLAIYLLGYWIRLSALSALAWRIMDLTSWLSHLGATAVSSLFWPLLLPWDLGWL